MSRCASLPSITTRWLLRVLGRMGGGWLALVERISTDPVCRALAAGVEAGGHGRESRLFLLAFPPSPSLAWAIPVQGSVHDD